MTTANAATNTQASSRWSKPSRKSALVASAAILAALALAALWALLPVNDYLRSAVEWMSEKGPLGVLAYVVIYVVCALVGIPRTILNIAAGVLFSYWLAIATVLVGAATAYSLTFVIARTVARDWVIKRLGESDQVRRLLQLVETEGFKLILLVRMNPFIPGVLKGYGFGTTNVAFRTYLSASLLGFLPLALAHVYLGWVGGEAMLYDGAELGSLETWLLLGGVAASVMLVAGIYVYGRRALNKKYMEH